MKVANVKEFAKNHLMQASDVFVYAWTYFHGAPSLKEEESIARDYYLWEDTQAIPKYVSDYMRPN